MATQSVGERPIPAWDEVALGFSVVILAAILAWQVMLIPATPLYARVGPAVFPWIVVMLLGGLGLALAVHGLLGGWPRDEEAGHLDKRGARLVALGLALNLILIDGADLEILGVAVIVPRFGFILAATVQFVLIARAFDSHRPIRDALIGFALACVAYAGFDQMIGYKIGDGIVEGYIQLAFRAIRGG